MPSMGGIWSFNGKLRFWERDNHGAWKEVPLPALPLPESAEFTELNITRKLSTGGQAGMSVKRVKIASSYYTFTNGILTLVEDK